MVIGTFLSSTNSTNAFPKKGAKPLLKSICFLNLARLGIPLELGKELSDEVVVW
jgi:hypothetical protein